MEETQQEQTKKKSYTIWYIFGVIVIVIFVFRFVYYSPSTQGINTEPQIKTLTLSTSNFIVLNKGFMNAYQESSCQKARAGDCSWVPLTDVKQCDLDVYIVTLKFLNLPIELSTTSSAIIASDLQIKAYSNGQEVGYKNPDGILQKLSFSNIEGGTAQIMLPLKYVYSNSLKLCFKIDGPNFGSAGNLISNEVCLDTINIPAGC